MQLQAKTMAAMIRWSAKKQTIISSLYLVSVLILIVSANVANAIVKQQQQPQSSSSPSQQQRSDDPSGYTNNNNHQQHSLSGASSASAGPQQVPSISNNGPQQQQQAGAPGAPSSYGGGASPINGISAAQPSASYANNNQKQPSVYMDTMAAAASNPEQSYQAAAQSVNMALANSGILNNANAYNQQPGNQAGQQQQSSGAAGASGSAAGSSLNPLHYFYYPAAKESIQGPSKQADAMANSASNQYYTAGQYGNYADQYQPQSFSNNNNNGPDAAASSQDASFLPQPMDGQSGPQQQQQQQPQQPAGPQQQQQQQHNFNSNTNDLASYASNQMQQQQPPQHQQGPGTISFGGPAASSVGQPQNGQAASGNDYMNSHMGGHQQQQQAAPMGSGSSPLAYQQNGQNMFNQLASGGDLSTSNFGNNAGGMSSIASYMAPNGMASTGANNGQHDLFANSLLGGQFNSAASQLSAASISPPPSQSQPQQQSPQQQQPQQQAQSPLFSSSLFGGQSQQQAASQQQQQQGGLFGGGAANPNNYLSTFLSPQQYSQLTGQQMGAMASEHTPMSLASAISAQQMHQQNQANAASQAAASSASSALSNTSSSSKRFGLGSFIMPMLALAGLSLLIPTMSNLGTAVGRKKRSVVEERASAANRQQQIAYEPLLNGPGQLLKESSIGEYMDRLERYYGIYRNAIESDECMNRLVCEFGDAVKDISPKAGPVMSVIEHLVPKWMAGKMHLFKEAAMNQKEGGKEKCKKYVCQNVADAGRQH